MSQLLGISGSISNPSKTKRATETALRGAGEEFDIVTKTLHLGEYDIATADGRKLDEYSGDTAKALDLIINSDAFLIGTPVYRGSCSGLLKNLLDLIPRGKWQSDKAPLEGRPIGLIATGATDHHFLSVAQELGPIASFFGAHQVGSGVYVNGSQFEGDRIIDEDVIRRLQNLGKATVELSRAINKSSFLSQFGPQF